MATVINNPSGESSSNGMGAGLVLGIVIAIALGFVVFFVYGWPFLQGTQPKEDSTTNINVEIPGTQNTGDQTQNQPSQQ